MVEQTQLVDDIGFDNNDIQGSKIAFYRGERNRIDQLTFPFPTNVKRAKVHYHDETKYFHCLSGYCCAHTTSFKYPVYRMGTVVIRWDMDKEGMPIVPYRGNVELWFISEDKYVDIKIANKRFPIAENDLLVRCIEENYQKLSIQSAGASI